MSPRAETPKDGVPEVIIPPELAGLDVADLPEALRVKVQQKKGADTPTGSRIQPRDGLKTSTNNTAAGSGSNLAGQPPKNTKGKSKKNAANFTISAPTGPAEHRVHVDQDFNWGGDDPTGAFKILDKLGEGGYGAVYKAMAKDSNFVLAIKMVLTGKSDKEEESLKKEIQILKKCHHPNVVSYYGAAKKDEHLWILMDFCGGGSIHDYTKKYKLTLTEKEIGAMCVATVKGLTYLHKLSIIHRCVLCSVAWRVSLDISCP